MFVNAPHKHSEKSAQGRDLYYWYKAVPEEEFKTTEKSEGLYESLEFLAKFIFEEEEERGAFDGVIGFSQGATVASLLAMFCGEAYPSDAEDDLLFQKLSFRFFIFFSGFICPAGS